MAYHTIDAFIQLLEEHDELIRVKDFVSPHLEMAEINDRLIKNNGKAVLFENTGTKFRGINQYDGKPKTDFHGTECQSSR